MWLDFREARYHNGLRWRELIRISKLPLECWSRTELKGMVWIQALQATFR